MSLPKCNRSTTARVRTAEALRDSDRQLRQSAETLEQRVVERTAELEASRAEAEAANLGKTRFIAAASHDLLQPLHAARLFTAAMMPVGESTVDRDRKSASESSVTRAGEERPTSAATSPSTSASRFTITSSGRLPESRNAATRCAPSSTDMPRALLCVICISRASCNAENPFLLDAAFHIA